MAVELPDPRRALEVVPRDLRQIIIPLHNDSAVIWLQEEEKCLTPCTIESDSSVP